MTAADELYGLPLDEFTRARNELERRLRNEGDGAGAKAVKDLRKPTTAAWALNQLARRRPPDVQGLIAAGERLRTAQADLLEGGDRAELTAAAAAEREMVGGLARDAATIAAEAGLPAGAALEEKLRQTLHAAATDEEAARELAAGRLVREREVVGLFGLAQAPTESAPERRRAAAPRRGSGRAARRDRRTAEAEETKRRAGELERRLKAAGGAEAKARRRLATAERAGATARERAAAAADRLRKAEAEEQASAEALEAARSEVRELEEELTLLRAGD